MNDIDNGSYSSEIRTLHQVLQPLVDFLQANYPAPHDEQYQFPVTDHFPRRNLEDDEASVELPDTLLDDELATRAVVTLLQVTGTEGAWASQHPSTGTGLTGPLRFRVEKAAAWGGYFWNWLRYLVVDHVDRDVDLAAAGQQIVALVAYLSNQGNLISPGSEELALF